MDAAFGLVPAAPAARARVLAGLDFRRARRAANRGIALRLERMTRKIVCLEIGIEILARPVRERVEFEPSTAPVELEAGQALAGRRLKSFAAGDGGVVSCQRLFERLDLAYVAAAVGVVGPAQFGRVLLRELFCIGGQVDDVETEARRQLIAISERFGEMFAGVEEQDRDIGR